ncbi:MAG: DUF1365 domain-containing protein [Betaproteobacteria bacterium]
MNPRLFHGSVFHARLRPRRNAFRYRVFFFRVPLSQLHRLENPVFSINRWNLFSFHYRDHGARDGSHPRAWVRGVLEEHGLHEADGEIWLQAFPRMLGYVFNPVSFWLCHDRAGALRAVVCEVNNTFGERHLYLLAHPDQRPILASDTMTARKVFHVSPFCHVAGEYRFQFSVVQDATHIRIDYADLDGKLLLTAVTGKGAPFNAAGLLRGFALYPGMTFGVIARIHLQALRLWIKGVPWITKPAPPSKELTR